MPDLRISVRGLSKRYSKRSARTRLGGLRSLFGKPASPDTDPFLALDDLNFDVRRGDRIGIIGRNGAGKSTLLKILSRVTVPTAGEVRIRGRLTALLEVGTGFDPNASGRTNIYLNAGLHSLSRKEIDDRFDDIVAFSGTGEFLDTPVKHYSSGMRMRLAFAIAAHLDPDILLLDEVLAVGDISFQQKCLQRVGELTEDDARSILFVSHSLGHVAQYCNKVLWLDKGKICFFGGVTEGIESYSDFMKPRTSIDLSDRRARKGTQIVRIVAVNVQKANDNSDAPIRTGDDIRFCVDYESLINESNKIEHILINIVIKNEHGARLFGTPSDVVNFSINNLKKNGRLICSIKNLPLISGVYSYNVGLHINHQLVDKVEEAGQLVVLEGDFYRTGNLPARSFGDVCVPFAWSVSTSAGKVHGTE